MSLLQILVLLCVASVAQSAPAFPEGSLLTFGDDFSLVPERNRYVHFVDSSNSSEEIVYVGISSDRAHEESEVDPLSSDRIIGGNFCGETQCPFAVRLSIGWVDVLKERYCMCSILLYAKTVSLSYVLNTIFDSYRRQLSWPTMPVFLDVIDVLDSRLRLS